MPITEINPSRSLAVVTHAGNVPYMYFATPFSCFSVRQVLKAIGQHLFAWRGDGMTAGCALVLQ